MKSAFVLRKKSTFVSTLVASAALGTGFMTPAQASEVTPLTYDDAIASVLASLRQERLAQSAASSQASVQTFDIPPGPLGGVVAAFTRLSGVAVTFATPGLDAIWSQGVSGRFTIDEALERLLADTGVAATFTSPSVVTLDIRQQTEFVEVVGGRPEVSLPAFTAPLRDIPQTVMVVKSDVIQSQGATTLRDVLRNVPGVTFQAGEGGGGLPGDTLTMRGFSAGNDIFVDGIRDVGAYSRDTFNLEQVEVIKGPASSIVGRGSTGGMINQVSKAPHMGASSFLSTGLGNSEYGRVTMDVNQPVKAFGDDAAVRVNAMWMNSGVPGREIVENGSWGIAPALAFGLNSPNKLTLKYQRLVQDNIPDYGLPWGSYPGYPTGAFEANPEIDQSNFYGLVNYDYEDIETDSVSSEYVREINPGWSLRNLTRWGQTSRDSAITAPRPPNRQLQRRTMGTEQIANHSNLNAGFLQGGVRHEVVMGLELSREWTSNRNSAQVTNQPATTIENPNPTQLPLGPMPANSGNPSETRLDLAGVYAFDTVSLGERWQVSGGARLDLVDAHSEQTTVATGAVTSAGRSDALVSWRAGVVFKPRPSGSLYAGAGTSFNPSVDGGNTGAGFGTATAANSADLEPERTLNVEAGTKWDVFGDRLSMTGALFHTEKTNARTRSATNEPFILDGRQRVRGVEVSLSGRVAEGWTALASYAFMDSEIEQSANAAEEGNGMTLTPEQTFSLWTTYQLPWRVAVGGGAQYMDAVYRNTLNTQQVPGYWLGNAVVQYDVNRLLTFRLNLQNLTDEQYVDRVGGGHYIPGPRRQAIASADVRF